MIDYVIVSVLSREILKGEPRERRLVDVVLFATYVVLAVAALVTAATLRAAKRADTSGITLAATAPVVYLCMLPFGVVTA